MNKPLVKYILSYTTDNSKWKESQYTNDTEAEYKNIIKKAEKKFELEGVVGVRIVKKTVEQVFSLNKEME